MIPVKEQLSVKCLWKHNVDENRIEIEQMPTKKC